MKTSLYVHVPFCGKKCDYCSFYSEPDAPQELVDSYCHSLLREIREYSALYPDISAGTIYFGGGTPAMMGSLNFSRVISAIRDSFDCSGVSEITVETNPFSTGEDFYETLLREGVTRITVGIQSFDDAVLNYLGRKSVSREKIEKIFSLPFKSRCADLICGVPGQTEISVENEIRIISGLGAEHISCYILSYDEGTPLYARDPGGADAAFQAGIFEHAARSISNAGYMHYEISNFALDGHASLHNRAYWESSPYLGFGPGAHSFVNKKRWSNSPDVNSYASGRREVVCDGRSEEAAMAEFFIMGLRLRSGISESRFCEIFGCGFPRKVMEKIEEGKSAGDLFFDSGVLRINWEKMMYSDSIIFNLCAVLL